MSYPTSLNDVKIFELNNKLCVHMYNINDNNDVITHQLGNLKYYKNMTFKFLKNKNP